METKLRAWDNVEEIMIYSTEEDSVFILENGEWEVKFIREKNLIRDGIEMDVPVWQYSEDIDIMLFTGLHDKNRKEIYEGDIIKYLLPNYPEKGMIEYVEEVRFEDGCFVVEGTPLYVTQDDAQGEVVGNIFQNSDLLEHLTPSEADLSLHKHLS